MTETHATKMASARIPTAYGEFALSLYQTRPDGEEHLALVLGDVAGREEVLIRVHSECLTGDLLGSLRCDCGEQLDLAMQIIAREGAGAVIYLRQEGRGIGLLDKLRAYNLQDEGYDTVDANLILGHQADEREYSVAADIIHDLNIQSILLLTNNLNKMESLEALGVTVSARVPLEVPATPENASYLQAKADRLNHALTLKPSGNGHGKPSNDASDTLEE